jgi:hypothetical protein
MENKDENVVEQEVDDATWNERHKLFLAEYNEMIEREGLALDEWRSW